LRLLPVVIFVLVAGFFAVALRSGDPSRLPSTMIGKAAPQSTFPAIDGLETDGKVIPGFAAADLADGKVKIVNFWASWCSECLDEHPLLDGLKTAGGISLYGVNYKDGADAARRFLGRYGNPFDKIGTDINGRSSIDWGVYGMPESFIVDGKGTIVYKQIGPMSPEIIQTKILPAIEAAKAGKAVAKG
jgi:cytochrome c biogenesis protein CcmG/thiol:disulfide interchange protein DsbE